MNGGLHAYLHPYISTPMYIYTIHSPIPYHIRQWGNFNPNTQYPIPHNTTGKFHRQTGHQTVLQSKSLERYNSQKVFVTKSWKRPEVLPSPAVTVCPSAGPDSGLGFKNILDHTCTGLNREELVHCLEKATFDLHDIVEFGGYDHMDEDTRPLVETHWKMFFNSGKGPCFTFHDFNHMPAGKALKIGLNKSFKHMVFFHDPNFFLKSENPAVPINRNVIEPGSHELMRLFLVEHENLDVPDKRCNSTKNYSFTNCVKEVFSNEVGCALHWDHGNLSLDIPKCANIDQYR